MNSSKPKYVTEAGDLDVNLLRKDFPILARDIRSGKRLTYLDTGATALKPQCVIDAISGYYTDYSANIHRAVHQLSEEATEAFEKTRLRIAKFVGSASESQVVFTSGTTFGINLMAKSFVEPRVKSGDEIIISSFEHHANIVPWHMLAKSHGVKLRVVPLTETGGFDLEAFRKMINPRTKFVSLIWASNALGTILPVKECIATCKQNQIPIHIDAAQMVSHRPLEFDAMGADFMTFSFHKLFGPTGVGVLLGKDQHFAEMPPVVGGGDMIKSVTFEDTTYTTHPAKFEAGTPDIASVIGAGEAVRFFSEDLSFEAIDRHESAIYREALAALRELAGVRLLGHKEPSLPIFSFLIDGVHPHDVGTILDQHGVAVRTGHHCTQPLMSLLGIAGSSRACFSIYNDKTDIDSLIHGIWRCKELFA